MQEIILDIGDIEGFSYSPYIIHLKKAIICSKCNNEILELSENNADVVELCTNIKEVKKPIYECSKCSNKFNIFIKYY